MEERRDYLTEIREFKQRQREKESDVFLVGGIYGSVVGFSTAFLIMLIYSVIYN